MWFKIVHTLIAVIFSISDFSLNHYDEIVEVNYLAFMRFCFYLIFMILILLNEEVFSEKNSNLIKEYMKISRYILGILSGYFAFNLLFYLPEFSLILCLILLYAGNILFILFEKTSKSNGTSEVLFTLITMPIIMLICQLIMFSTYHFDTLLNFAPCNFLFFILCITYTSKISVFEKYEKFNIFSISKLLGKQDSFRIIVILLCYLYYSLIFDSLKKQTLM